MANKKIQSVKLLPEVLRTDRNKKFLSSTIDQLIQPAELERIDGYIGSTQSPTYKSSDNYLPGNVPYQLDPALIIQDSLENILEVQGYDDLINEIAVKGGYTNNLDRLFRSKIYSFNPHIDWDKLANYQHYYWLVNGPEVIRVTTNNLNVDTLIIGQPTANIDVGSHSIPLSNGMLLNFIGTGLDTKYYDTDFFVEGVGTAIKLISLKTLVVSDSFITEYPDGLDMTPFDSLPFDNDRDVPDTPEYVTITRASTDINPWSRYNRWVHQDVIKISSEINGNIPVYPSSSRAQRPIIEFKADIQLFNFGTVGIESVDFIDTQTIDAFGTIDGSTDPVYVDGVELEQGHRVIFTVDTNNAVKNKIYQVNVSYSGGQRTLNLVSAYDHAPASGATTVILRGSIYSGTAWWFNGTAWIHAQQRTKLNQAPLFDLYDTNGHSYGDKNYYLSNFTGNKIFAYKEGSGSVDPYLGFSIDYRNTSAIGSILFTNNLVTDSIVISQLGITTYSISTNQTYCKIGNSYENAWTVAVDYPIPVITQTATSVISYYEEPLSLTNNPLNGTISQFTISELTEHVQTMVSRLPPNTTNLRDLADYTTYGTKLISNENPISFAQMFIGKKENSVIDAISKSADQYNQFKLTFLNSIINFSNQLDPVLAVDSILTELNQNNAGLAPYYLTDMVGYGTPEISRTWTVSNTANVFYPINSEFDLVSLSLRSVLVYLNGVQLIHGVDYVFDIPSTSVEILTTLTVGDVIVINDYTNTEGAYIPPTPTKLGLYPKFVPSKFLDDTYVTPTWVIQGHDGSITVAYNDYRDDIIIELEKRIYNNIKAQYRSELLNINSIIPGAFRTTDYSLQEINKILQQDLVKWAGKYGINYTDHATFDRNNSFTWNFSQSATPFNDTLLTGSWRSIYKYFYDTDRPHTHPWEMLGFTQQPDWWTTAYGTNYASTNTQMWADIALGYNTNADTYDSFYTRADLSNVLPVDNTGTLRDPAIVFGVSPLTGLTSDDLISQLWLAGDQGPAETAWRRSSFWPFAVQRLLALTVPATYTSLMYDPSRVQQNNSKQWSYGSSETFFRLSDLFIHGENNSLTSGYSVLVSEIGKQRTSQYFTELRQNLEYADYRLLYKVGGFVDQNTLQIIIDAFAPTSTSPGALLPSQNYKLRLNVSNPISSIGISGFIIQKLNGNFIIKGYDSKNSFFTYNKPIRNIGTPAITIGGISASYVTWAPSGTSGTTGSFYQKGQYVLYGNKYYIVKVAHQSSDIFNPSYFQIVPNLPTVGGATVQIATGFESKVTQVPYGTTFTNIQDVYDLIIGYGYWLTKNGFIFNEYNIDLDSVIDWSLSSKEFLYWTTQNWNNGSVITLSPFADKLVYTSDNSVVDNVFGNFYEYSFLRADGTPYPKESLTISRNDGVCEISTLPGTDGIYFARLNCVQKEHAIIFDNSTIFGDVIYDVETGSRQRRMKLSGFRTAGWNGDFTSPGFVYDTAKVSSWSKSTSYIAGDVVSFSGNYYSAIKNIDGAETFDFTKWDILNKKPTAGLLPNFDYKINQFEDFYSLDSDNFDAGQQKMAQHLTGYTPRPYLNNIFTDPVAQYKFYQGFIKEKGTKNAISKLSKASLATLNTDISFNEEWAFRIGSYGGFTTYQELEVPLIEGTFLENPQIINFVDQAPPESANNLIHYSLTTDLQITPDNYVSSQTFVTTSSQDIMLLTHSGYVRIDDVTATAYNENSLLDIANNSQLKNGDTIWLGFKQNGDWDVYRYTYSPVGIVGVFLSAPLSNITFTTNANHNLSVGQIVSIARFNSQVNGIYIVQAIPDSTQFIVATDLAAIENAPLPAPGQLYIFKSARISDFDQLPSDKEIYRLATGTKFWVDATAVRGWEVYEKINNYSSTSYQSRASDNGLGETISKRKGSDIVVVAGPKGIQLDNRGIVVVFKENTDGSLQRLILYRYSTTDTGENEFGYSLVYDDTPFYNSAYGLIFAGAPKFNSSIGSVKVSSINSSLLVEGTHVYIANPNPAIGRFGSSIYVERNATNKLVLVGSSQAVYAYTVQDNNGSIACSTPTTVITGHNINSMAGADDASIIAIGLIGSVQIYNKGLEKTQTLTDENSSFGKTITVSPTGGYLFVSIPNITNTDGSCGKVVVYKNNNGTFILDQILENPVAKSGMNFGTAIDVTTDVDTLVISAVGTNRTFPTVIDNNTTIFDGGITKFKGTEENSGAVYLYYKNNSRFVFSQELTTSSIATIPGTDFGISISVDNNVVLVGAPAIENTAIRSTVYQFNKIDTASYSWKKIRYQDNLVETNKIQKVLLLDTFKDQVTEYLDVIDPVKGKVAGIAEQELHYKLISDPAIYSIGVAGTNNNTTKNWLDAHVGELWWDLSTAKYMWYEQSDLEFRKNNWGKLFPGSSIDIYEWVGSQLLPSEWASQADTPIGLTKGISGQPKYPDNSVISVKQVYDPITNTFGNVYYYWVKNKVTVPNAKDRRISSYEVASIIADPTAYGLKFASVISGNAIALSNIGSMLIDNRINLHIAQNLSELGINTPTRHTEWLLMQENSAVSMPPAILEKKLVDSLLGHDSLGNPVPDTTLTPRTRYGIGIRPQQTLFKNRLEALRNVIEFSNSILINERVTGNYSFSNLNAQEEIPSKYTNSYDLLVEDNNQLSTVSTSGYVRAVLECRVNTGGNAHSVYIINPGHGYGTLNPVRNPAGDLVGYEGPTFVQSNYSIVNITTFDNTTTTGTIFDNGLTTFTGIYKPSEYGRDLVVSTIVDAAGSIISASIINSGFGYISDFRLQSRSHAVIVQSDDSYNGKWTRYEFDYATLKWNRVHTQSFNTTLYWDYADWASLDYNPYQIYSYVIGSPYELAEVTLISGQYVKINNGGDGRYIVLRKIDDVVFGSFTKGYDIVYSERGTIQISNALWNLLDSGLGWDYINTYDQTLWDQTPDIELRNILKALKENIFINSLRVNWNKLFFKAIKYALSEQKLLDWAFKTSFIGVVSNAGELNQPPVYKLQDSLYYEQYINEVKPYHTQIRTYTTNHAISNEHGLMSVADIDRAIETTIKFDRVSSVNEAGNFDVTDIFICNGIDREFVLSWIANNDKLTTTIRLNGILILSARYAIVTYNELQNGELRKFSKIVFADVTPEPGQVLSISYRKDSGSLYATDRILSYYTATSGMPGVDLGQLMTGIEFPGLVVGGQYEGKGFANLYGGTYADSRISGGTWTNSQLSGALGIDPTDISLNGEYGFLTPSSGHAPEEVVPGFVTESLGISVYTKGAASVPVILSGNANVISTSSYQRISISILPPSIDSLFVVLDNSLLNYTDNTTPSYSEYTLDWLTKEIVIGPRIYPGTLGYTIVELGGGSGNSLGIVDYQTVTVTSTATARLESIIELYSQDGTQLVQDVFVTVNGMPIDKALTTSSFGYQLLNDVQANRAYVEVYNIPNQAGVVQAWFFSESQSYFNEIREQVINITNTSTATFALLYPPQPNGNQSVNAIVELTSGGVTKKLVPSDSIFPAIYDYTITGTNLIIAPSVTLSVGDSIKAITFTSDSSGIRVEKFVANSNRRFQLSRLILDVSYMWVTLISTSITYELINGIDFIVLDDNLTVQISDSWVINTGDLFEVTSFTTPASNFDTIGYKIFHDMLGGTTYTRISGKNITYLTEPLLIGDTEIHVADASVLSQPNTGTNVPGVIFINAERIEFFVTNDANTILSQLRRGTMGTSPSVHLDVGSKVVDHGALQLINTPESVHIQNTFTNTLTNVYVIGKNTTTIYYPGSTTSTVQCDGIALSTSTLLNPVDQVEVYFGGHQLRKNGMYVHDTTKTYYSVSPSSIVGSTSTVSLLPEFSNIGDSYLVQDTNEVWTYTGSRSESTATSRYVYSGLHYLSPEFTITTGQEQQLTLNTSTIDITQDVQLTVVQKELSADNVWNDVITSTSTRSLFESTTTVAVFLRNSLTELPNNYYYGR